MQAQFKLTITKKESAIRRERNVFEGIDKLLRETEIDKFPRIFERSDNGIVQQWTSYKLPHGIVRYARSKEMLDVAKITSRSRKFRYVYTVIIHIDSSNNDFVDDLIKRLESVRENYT